MTGGTPDRLVLFEPWSLGDVIIAASILRELPAAAALACHSQWHPLLRAALPDRPDLEFIPVDLPYTTRNRVNPFDSAGTISPSPREDFATVLSIRGDARDYAAARKAFPKAQIRMNGWLRFFARKNSLLNAPFALGLLDVQNRYRSWAKFAGIPFSQIEQTYRRLQAEAPSDGSVVIHLGAQWRSKQFPDVLPLRDQLENDGWQVALIAGPGDSLPAGVREEDVTRAVSAELVACLRAAEHVITNDSGPMHLAAFLGCRTTALARTTPIEEWAPPDVRILASARIPRGYRPHPRYMSDETLADWPSVQTIAAGLKARATDPRRDAPQRNAATAA